MGKIVDMDKYREQVDSKKWSEADYYDEMIHLLWPVKLSWQGSRLQIRYEIGWENIYRQFLNERAWVLRVFGAVRRIIQEAGVDAVTTLAFPDINYVIKEKKEGNVSTLEKDLLVTWRTKEPAPANIVLEADALKTREEYNIGYRY